MSVDLRVPKKISACRLQWSFFLGHGTLYLQRHAPPRAGWSKAGLYPFHPEKVLQGMSKPVVSQTSWQKSSEQSELCENGQQICTPTTSISFNVLRDQVEHDLSSLDEQARFRITKLANAGADIFAERALLRDRERTLLEQNNEKKQRQSVRSTVVGKAKVMSYEDIVEARNKREMREKNKAERSKRRLKDKSSARQVHRMDAVQEEESSVE